MLNGEVAVVWEWVVVGGDEWAERRVLRSAQDDRVKKGEEYSERGTGVDGAELDVGRCGVKEKNKSDLCRFAPAFGRVEPR